MRITGIELRRSAALGTGLLILAIGAGLLVSVPYSYASRWTQLASSARVLLLVLWPLALAGGAWLGRREARSRVGELFATTARPRWQRVLPTAAALAVAVLAGYLVMLIAGAGFVVFSATHFAVGALGLVAVGGVSLVTAAWLGLAAGRAMPWLATAPALAVLGVVVVGLLPDLVNVNHFIVDDDPPPAALMLSPVYVGGLDDFQTFGLGASLVQLLWLGAVAATGLLLFGATRARSRVLAVLPAALGLAVTLPLLPTGAYEGGTDPDRAAVALVCDDAGPQVCMTKVHAGLLPDVTGPAREALALLATRLPDAPTRAVESDRPQSWVRPGSMPEPRRYGADTLVFTAPSYGRTGRADFDGEPFVPWLLTEVWRLDCDQRPVEHDAYLGQEVATSWLLGRPFGADPDLPAAYERFLGKPVDEQRALLAAARVGARSCDPDALAALIR
ncbi:hypothetical protein [Virgisporangium aurantiacum]|uniref:ABC-type transport system involved in multi-copper enzyme maturation, permease component n=1 Tax=Virgisporangium aurantiacum TaxID=175570 RepID=A0A8J4E3L0_9ACTN|nr:hypothetical protein [Virgisporangium aurantiacum]GIJ60985.1 hypothetical protein Vau01_085010 [Virgisporangium aurantiacum]